MTIGVPPRFDQPDRYTGSQLALTPIVRNPRAPTTHDRNYPLNQFWENVDKNAVLPDAYGDLWYLAYFKSNGTFPADAIWIKLASGVNPPAGNVISLSDTLSVKTFPDGTGNIQLNSLSPGLTIVSDPPNNKIDFTLVGGGPFIDNILVQAATAPGVNPVVPDGTGQMRVAGNLVAAHAVPIETRTRNVNEYNIEPQISSAQAVSTLSANGMSHFDSARFTVGANGFVSASGTGLIQTLTPDEDFDGSAATPVAPQAGTINVFGARPAVAPVTETYNSTGLSTGNLEVEHRAWISALVVDPSTTPGSRGTFATITAANAAASSGQLIIIRDGTYTENFTAKAGVTYAAFSGQSFNPNVTIKGKISFSSAGKAAFSNVRLETNGDFFLAVTGSSASAMNFNNCVLACTDNDGISCTSSSSGTNLNFYNCQVTISSNALKLFADTSAGDLVFFACRGGSSTTASTKSAGRLSIEICDFFFPITTSGTNQLGIVNSDIDCGANVTAVTAGGSVTQAIYNSRLDGSTQPALTCTSNNVYVLNTIISSSNTNAIDGAGTIHYSGLTFEDTSNTIGTTTIVRLVLDGGEYKGRTSNTAPSAGMIGEEIRSAVASGSAITLTPSGTALNITSINLTAGIWNVSSVAMFTQTAAGTASDVKSSISTTSATHGTLGDNSITTISPVNAVYDQALTIPSYRLSLAGPTTVYLVGSADFSGGTIKGYGRISATRVA